MKNVSVTFDGTPDGVDAEMLKLIGLADGAGIVITDEAGATINVVWRRWARPWIRAVTA